MKSLLLLLTLLFLNACSTQKTPPQLKVHKKEYRLEDRNSIILSLKRAYKRWENRPYSYGGNSRKGIDCSSLVQTIYRDAFNITLPRTTKAQSKIGYKITKKEIKEGDLIFFKTGTSMYHSGIYLEDGNFINASTKKGVTISNINNPYWKSRYWQSRRVLNIK